MAYAATHSVTNASPKTSVPRPILPSDLANPHLQTIDPAKVPQVKFQVITREGQDIVVGRVKIPTPGGNHAFILRRFDTGAVSQTTMFRAAYPQATDDQEKTESAWIKANYDNGGANGTAGSAPTRNLRLAGTWVAAATALTLAPDYSLQHVLPPLIAAMPDSSVTYRKSLKASSASPAASIAPPRQDPPSSPSAPNKRARKEPSPAPAPTRQSARLKSPGVTVTSPRQTTPRRGRTPRGSKIVAAAKVETSDIDEEPEELPDIPGPDPEADIAESKKLVQELKAKRDRVREAANGLVEATQNTKKRSAQEQREDEAALMRFNNLEGETPDRMDMEVARPIASNRRLNIRLNAEQKALAWGTLAFAFGMGITSFILPMLT